MTKKYFTVQDLKKFIVNTVWVELPDNCKTDRVALVNIINNRVDLCFKPLSDWIINDGELNSIIEIVGNIMDDPENDRENDGFFL